MFILSISVSFAQTPCSPGSYVVFSDSNGETPVLLKRLGTSPQFGEIPKHTSESAFSHLNMVYKRNVRNSKGELDAFFKAMGYTGFKDPAFNVTKITPKVLPAGTTGWMGAYSKGHKYKWSTLGADFPTFQIQSADGTCSAYVMKKCGNAFFDPSTRCVPCTPCDPNYNDFTKCPQNAPKVTCATQTVNFSGKGKIQAGDVINTKQTFPVVATFQNENLCLGDYELPVRLSYDLHTTADASFTKTVKVCDYGNGTLSNVDVTLPMELKHMFEASDVVIGDNGKIVMSVVDEKQFGALKKAFKSCANAAGTNTGKNLVAKTTDVTAATVTELSPTEGQDCVKQNWAIKGSAESDEVSNKSGNTEVTVVGVYKKTGKLAKGETAEKNLCLGVFSIPAKSALQYNSVANANMNHLVELCGTNGTTKTAEDLSVPMKLTKTVDKQDVMVGDYGRIYVPIDKKQYNSLKKKYRACCNGGEGKCF
ncbi:MAG: hypothetical protein ACRCVT_06715 [Leadbetterella sp.]